MSYRVGLFRDGKCAGFIDGLEHGYPTREQAESSLRSFQAKFDRHRQKMERLGRTPVGSRADMRIVKTES